MELTKLKINFNYTLARIKSGEVYVLTNKYIESTPEEQEKAIKMLEQLNNNLKLYRIKYKELTGKEMTEKEFENGFYDEFRDSHMKASEFINLIDYNKHIMNIKGSQVMNNYKLIIITSLFHPKKIYNNMTEEAREQWLRRIKIINTSTSDITERLSWDELIKF